MHAFHWRRFIGRTLRVQTIDGRAGTSVEGVLTSASRRLIILRASRLVTDPDRDDRNPQMDGEVAIERSAIIFAQVLP